MKDIYEIYVRLARYTNYIKKQRYEKTITVKKYEYDEIEDLVIFEDYTSINKNSFNKIECRQNDDDLCALSIIIDDYEKIIGTAEMLKSSAEEVCKNKELINDSYKYLRECDFEGIEGYTFNPLLSLM